MDDYWGNEYVEKNWDDNQNKEVLDLLKIKPVAKVKKEIFIPPKPVRKQEYFKKLKWNYVVDINELDKTVYPVKDRRLHDIIIPNGRVLIEFKKALKSHKLYVKSEKGYISTIGSIYFYLAEIGYIQNSKVRNNVDYEFCCGFINYNSKERHGCRFIRGETITNGIDDPLEIFFKRGFTTKSTLQHTKNVVNTMRKKCNIGIEEFTQYNRQRKSEINKLKCRKVSDATFGFFLMHLMYKLKNWGVLSIFEIRNLTEHWWSRNYPKTMWGLEQAFINTFQRVRNPSRRIYIFNAYYDISNYMTLTKDIHLKLT